MMRFGGGIEKEYSNPQEWLELVHQLGYSAVIAPIDYTATKEEKSDYLRCIKENNLIIGEVGVWKNPISTDDKESKEALEYCKNQLSLADELHANCCVNIVGSRGEIWDGAYQDNYEEDTYAIIIDSIRDIIDSVNPSNTYYTIEPMPWMVPDSPDQYLKLLKDVDRKSFGVHLDYTNMINCPKTYLYSTRFINECFEKLGPYIKSIHAKDVSMKSGLPCIIEETLPGTGIIDYHNVLKQSEKLGSNTTVFIEHLKTFEEYKRSADYIRGIADMDKIKI